MRIDIVTIFPKMVRGTLEEGIVARAMARDLLEIVVHDLRDFTTDRHRVVDDVPRDPAREGATASIQRVRSRSMSCDAFMPVAPD